MADHKSLADAVAAAMVNITQLGKGSRNKFANYNYATVEDFVEHVRPKLAAEGVFITQSCVSSEVQGATQDKAGNLICHYEFSVHHSSGSLGPIGQHASAPANMGPQAYGAAESYALKNFLRSTLLISSDENPDEAEHTVDGSKGDTLTPSRKATDERKELLAAVWRGAQMLTITEECPMGDDVAAKSLLTETAGRLNLPTESAKLDNAQLAVLLDDLGNQA